ncbi:MAG: ATP-binding protein [Acidobacteria bacterium]|nr:ATP-binding protein [Acidobacteriota bacterium]
MSEPTEVPPQCEFDVEKLVLKFELVVPSDLRVLDDVVPQITRVMEGTGCQAEWEGVELALHEALANAIVHGNRGDPTKGVRICVAVQEGCGILVVVKDVGSSFDPAALCNPVRADNLLAPHGRGLFLINQLVDGVAFNFEKGTEIWLRRRGRTDEA